MCGMRRARTAPLPLYCMAAMWQRRYVDIGFSRHVETIVLILKLAATSSYSESGPVNVYVTDTLGSPGTYCAFSAIMPGGVARHAFGCNGAAGRYAVVANPLFALDIKDLQVYLYDAPGAEV